MGGWKEKEEGGFRTIAIRKRLPNPRRFHGRAYVPGEDASQAQAGQRGEERRRTMEAGEVGGWVGFARKVENEEEAVRMRCFGRWVGGRVVCGGLVGGRVMAVDTYRGGMLALHVRGENL